jgi:UDP-N-acetylmuramoyl-L-alanyl-D-glutamate--2,6-diaminopimelate ligase
MASYAATKARLFSEVNLKNAVINADDPFGVTLLEMMPDQVNTLSYGLRHGSVRARSVLPRRDGLDLEVDTPQGRVELSSGMLGRFNASNLLAALACLLVLGLPAQDAARRLSRVRAVAGRMERFVGSGRQPVVVVDYAHTPDALEKALTALREHTEGRLWCVFGCGGDRDRQKRPVMGQQAERLADVVVLTDDNPRHESPERIVMEICAGMSSRPTIIHDRVAAIRWAVHQAVGDDVVLVAGKGHESTQQVGDQFKPLSDRETVTSLMGMAA